MNNTETQKESSVVVAYNIENEKPELVLNITDNKCDENGKTEF